MRAFLEGPVYWSIYRFLHPVKGPAFWFGAGVSLLLFAGVAVPLLAALGVGIYVALRDAINGNVGNFLIDLAAIASIGVLLYACWRIVKTPNPDR